MKALIVEALGSRAAQLAALVLILLALALAGCRSAADAWEPRTVSREESEDKLGRALVFAQAAESADEIRIAGRDIWAIAADAALTAHPECASVEGSGLSGYPREGMGVVEGLDEDSPLPADLEDSYFVHVYGEPSRTYIDERRVVRLWVKLGAPRDAAVVAAEYIPETDGFAGESEIEWRRTAEIHISYCYDADGEELANFDREALQPLNLAELDWYDYSLSREVAVRVRQPGEFLCGEEVTANFDYEGFDQNAPEYSGLAEGSDPTPELLEALRWPGDDSDDFELWHVVSPRRALFASLDDRGQDPQNPTLVGQYAYVVWIGFNAEGVPIWGEDTAGSLHICDPDEW